MIEYLTIPLGNGEFIEGSRETIRQRLRIRVRLCAGSVIREAKRITLNLAEPIPAEFSRDPQIVNSVYNRDAERLNDALRLLARG